MDIEEGVVQLLNIVSGLNSSYPKRSFTLDGRLVGDIGEVLVEQRYDLELFEGVQPHHDACTPNGRQVQIKATMKKSLSFPTDHIPDYYLGIVINSDGSFDEIFNGPGAIVHSCVANRALTKNGLHMITLYALRKLNETVPPEERIPLRNGQTAPA